MVRLRAWVAVAVGMASSFDALSARADVTAAEKASAEALFDEGMRLMRLGSVAEACPKFEMSQRVEAAVGTLLYLGECYERTGRTASGWAIFREAAALAESVGQVERMKTARARAARLEPNLAWLTIELQQQTRTLPGLQIRRNSAPVQVELTGVPIPTDPGDVLVEASAPDHVGFATKIALGAKDRVVVAIPVLAAAPSVPGAVGVAAAPGAAAVSAAPPASPYPSRPAEAALSPAPERTQHRSIVPWLVGGAGLVGVGIGSYFGIKAISNASDARKTCPEGLCNEQNGQTQADDSRSAAKVSNVAFVLGAAAVASGVILYFALPTKQSVQLGVSPARGASGMALVLNGRFGL